MKLYYILILGALTAGCHAKMGNPVMNRSESGINEQMQPLKTKAEVRETFGDPDLVFQKGGAETYEYKRVDGRGRLHWLIPVIGPIISIFQDDFTFEETNLFVRFNKDKVKDWSVIQSGGTTD
ncbi:MAG: hypothetical protein LBB23_04670 [Rickettsiales bacterium]|jgi:hypothetical protein|nr:hypothetical protein [Rickettsiales bacterium]